MPGMDLVYRLWVNTDETKTITYPNRHSSHGGLKHLDEAERDRISSLQVVPPHLCCSDASRLYRMYQDTIVDVDWIVMLVIKGLLESRKRIVEPIKRGDWHWAATEILPPAVEGIRCLYLDNRPKGVVWVEWDKPWNGARVEKFSVYCVNNGKEYIAEQTSMVLDDGKIFVVIITS